VLFRFQDFSAIFTLALRSTASACSAVTLCNWLRSDSATICTTLTGLPVSFASPSIIASVAGVDALLQNVV